MYIQTKKSKQELFLNFTTFPGGERMPRPISVSERESVVITQSIENPQDLFDLAQVVSALRLQFVKEILLIAPYIMGGRQDRVCNRGEAFTAQVVANMINTIGFDEVWTDFPHSDVLPALINNCVVRTRPMHEAIGTAMTMLPEFERLILVAPDAGASKKVLDVAYFLEENDVENEFVGAYKTRDTKTGKLSGFGVNRIFEFKKGDQVLVIDDICANGGTFIGLAKELKRLKCNDPAIFVAHTDTVKGLENISPHYPNGVYTTDSRMIEPTEDENITQITLML